MCVRSRIWLFAKVVVVVDVVALSVGDDVVVVVYCFVQTARRVGEV
jgi:hypothetical protein